MFPSDWFPGMKTGFFFTATPTNASLINVELPAENAWFDVFAERIAPYCHGFDARKKIAEHIGPNSTFTFRDQLRRMLFLMHQWPDDAKMASKWTLFAPKIAEGLENCTPGLFERCTMIMNQCFRPKNLQELLSKFRHDLIENYIQSKPYLADIHDAELVYMLAQTLNFGVNAATALQTSANPEFQERIKNELNFLFICHYQLPFIVTDLIAQIDTEMRTEFNYSGALAEDDPLGYPVGLVGALGKALRPLFTMPTQESSPDDEEREEAFEDWMDCLILKDPDNEDYRILDIDWVQIHFKLWEFLFDNNLVVKLTEDQENRFLNGIVANPSDEDKMAFVSDINGAVAAHNWVLYAYQVLPWFPQFYALSDKTNSKVDSLPLIAGCLQRQPEKFQMIIKDHGLQFEQITNKYYDQLMRCIFEKNSEGFAVYLQWLYDHDVLVNAIMVAESVIYSGTLPMLEKMYPLYPLLDSQRLLIIAVGQKSITFTRYLIEIQKTSTHLMNSNMELIELPLNALPVDVEMANYLLSHGVASINALLTALRIPAVPTSLVRRTLSYFDKTNPQIHSELQNIILAYYEVAQDDRYVNKVISLKDYLFLSTLMQSPQNIDRAYYLLLTIDRVVDLLLTTDDSDCLDRFYHLMRHETAQGLLPITINIDTERYNTSAFAIPQMAPVLQSKASRCFSVIQTYFGFTLDYLFTNVIPRLRGMPTATQEFWINYLTSLPILHNEGITQLHLACYLGMLSYSKQLVAASDTPQQLVNTASKNNCKPIHMAIESNSVELVLYLMEQGATPKDRLHNTISTVYNVSNLAMLAQLVSATDIKKEIKDILTMAHTRLGDINNKAKSMMNIITAKESLTINDTCIVTYIFSAPILKVLGKGNDSRLLLAKILTGITELCEKRPAMQEEIWSWLFMIREGETQPNINNLYRVSDKTIFQYVLQILSEQNLGIEHFQMLLNLPALPVEKRKDIAKEWLKNLIAREKEGGEPQAKRRKITNSQFFQPVSASSVAKKMLVKMNSKGRPVAINEEEINVIEANPKMQVIFNNFYYVEDGFIIRKAKSPEAPEASSSSSHVDLGFQSGASFNH